MSSESFPIEVEYLVVGSAAAGSVLAAKFAEKGKTLFVDKYLPGTLMNCGGGMPEKVFRSFDVDIPFLPIKKAVMNIGGRECWFPCNYVVVNRSEFDHALYKKACAAGAEFRLLNYKSHDPEKKLALFKEKQQSIEVKYQKLIFTCGFHPRKNLFTGNDIKLSSGAAKVEIIDRKSPHPEEFYFYIYEQKLPGYQWIFPMPGNKTNIGSGGFKTVNVPLASLVDLKAKAELTGEVIKKGGGVLPLAPVARIQHGDVFLFGDSAGMVNALNGEGLMHIAKFADPFVAGVYKGKNMNFKWRFSGTYCYLSCASWVLKILILLGKMTRIPFYPLACRLVAFVRRCKG